MKKEHIKKINDELKIAKRLYPEFPDDIIHAVSVMNEEAGESIRASLNYVYHDYSIDLLENELI